MFRPLFQGGMGLATWLGMGLAFGALPPSEQLLPDSTVALVSIPDVPAAVDAFNSSPLGRLLSDPLLEAFREDLIAQLHRKGVAVEERIGLSMSELDGLASGEVALAIVKTAEGKASGVALVDVTGNLPKARTTLDQIDKTLKGRKAERSQQASKTAGVELTVYKIPPAGGRRRTLNAYYFIHDNLLVAADDLATMEAIAANLVAGGSKTGTLAATTPYETIMKRTEHPQDQGDFATTLRWFVRPVEGLDAVLATMERKLDRDLGKLARDEGYDALQAVGGRVTLAAAPYGVIHRTCAYAPKPFKRSMRMLDFPNVERFEPQPWVAESADAYLTFSWNIPGAFDAFGTLFDAVVGEGEEGVWGDVLDSLKTDPNGPQLDIRQELVAHLGTRGSMMTETELPIGPHSQRRIFAAQTTNEAALAKAVEKMMKNDKSVQIRTLKVDDVDHQIFLIVPQDDQMPKLDVQGFDPPGGTGDKPAATAHQPEKLLEHSAVAVAHGHLFIATHIDLLEKVLRSPAADKPLSASSDYQRITEQLGKLHAGPRSLQAFTRNDERFQTQYELFRQGHLPEADLLATQAINAILEEQGQLEEGQVRPQSLDGSKLPPYESVRKYLGLGGVVSQSLDDGWVLMGFTLDDVDSKEKAAAQAATPKIEK